MFGSHTGQRGSEVKIVGQLSLTRLFLVLLLALSSASAGVVMAEESDSQAPASPEVVTTEATEESTPAEDEGAAPEADVTPEDTVPVTGETPEADPIDSAPAARSESAPSFTITADPNDIATSDVSLNLASADPSLASSLPSDATWTVTSVENPQQSFTDTFSAAHRTLPAVISVLDGVPYGHYTVEVNAEPVFQTYTNTLRVDSETESFNIVLTPVKTAQVTIGVASLNPAIAATLPEDASWTVTSADNPEFAFEDTFSAAHLALPTTIPVQAPIPYGTYTVTVDASPVFKPFTTTFTVNQASQTFQVQLDPIPTQTVVTIKISSANPTRANVLPDDASWTVTRGTQVFGDDFAENHRQLPATIEVESPLPVGEYTIAIDAGPEFQQYTAKVTLSAATQTVEVILQPVTLDPTDELVAELVALLIQILEDILSGAVEM